MSTNFLSLPSELRNNIYEQLLEVQTPIRPYTPWKPRPQLTPGLLRVNQTIHKEASSVLYGNNSFYLTRCGVELFFKQIGRKNSSYIRHIEIPFPRFDHLNVQDVTLDENSSRMLAEIQSYCTNLTTIEIPMNSIDQTEVVLDKFGDNLVAEALVMLDFRFRAISSLQKIIVNAHIYKYYIGQRSYIEERNSYMRERMLNHGWTFNTQFIHWWK